MRRRPRPSLDHATVGRAAAARVDDGSAFRGPLGHHHRYFTSARLVSLVLARAR